MVDVATAFDVKNTISIPFSLSWKQAGVRSTNKWTFDRVHFFMNDLGQKWSARPWNVCRYCPVVATKKWPTSI